MSKASTDLVSVIICTYNGAQYLTQQLASICAQTYTNLEVIIVDDCSVDETFAIAEEFAQKHTYIKCLVNPENMGVNKNMAQGFKLAKGEYICPCDQDDVWEENKIEVLVDLIQAKNCSLVYCDAYLTDEDLNKTGFTEKDKNAFIEGFDYKNLLLSNCISGHAMLFETALLAHVFPLPISHILYDQWIGVAATLQKGVFYTSLPLVYFRRHVRAHTNTNRNKMEHYRHIEAALNCLKCHSGMSISEKKYVENLSLCFGNQRTIGNKYKLWFNLLLNLNALFKIRGKGLLSNMVYSFKLAFVG